MLTLISSAKQIIIEDAIRTFPDECCGFLLGTEQGEERTIEDILIVENAKEGDKRRRFKITAQDYMKAERFALEKELDLLGVYHSHPNHPSVPSEHDRKVAQPFFSYLIVSIREGSFASLQSWRLNDDFQFEEEQVQEVLAATIPSTEIDTAKKSFHSLKIKSPIKN